jgi:hypothetical protein
MKTKTLWFLIAIALLIAAVPESWGTTVPAGTILIIRTLRSVSAEDMPGLAVPAELARPVAINGKVAIRVGTHVSGKVITSHRVTRSSDRLTVDLVSAHLAGRDVPITTTGRQPLSNDIKTRSGIGISRTNYTVPKGKLMQFQLARPLVF